MNKTVIGIVAAIIFAIGVLLVLRPTANAPTSESNSPSNEANNEIINEEDGSQRVIFGQQLANSYYAFDQRDFDNFRQTKTPMVLFFYANWCPTCAVQEPINVKAMNSGISGKAVMLRVNYSDPETDVSEKALAQEYAVTYQHTYVVLSEDGKVVAIMNGHQSESDLNNLFSQLK